MPKKSESVRGGKSNNEHSPMKDRSQKPNRGEASYGGGGRQKKEREMKPSGKNKNPFGGIGKVMSGSGTLTSSDDNAFEGIRSLSGSKKSKNGCFPKLFMLLLPIAAGAAYFFLNS
jgi:hypothetical protein